MTGLNLRWMSAVLLAAVAGLSACKAKSTYVHVKILPGPQGEPVSVTQVELDLSLAGKTSTLTLGDASTPITLPTDVTLEVKSGSGQLAITVIARNAAGAEVDRGATTAQVSTGAIAEATVLLPGGKPDVKPAEGNGSHDFGAVPEGTASASVNVTFINNGFRSSGPLSVALGGAGAAAFALGTNTCAGTALAPGASCSVAVQFAPVSLGALAATLTTTGTPGGSTVVTLTGTGSNNPLVLTVAPAGNGQGTVTSSPAGVTCPGTCSPSFEWGTSVTLTATPATGSTFAGWAGCDSVNGSMCTVAVTSARTATATFSLQTFMITVATIGGGTGKVTADLPGIDCGNGATACSAVYNYGISVVLSATPATNSNFDSWSGAVPACVGAGSCAVIMTQDQNVTVTFALKFCAASVTAAQLFSSTMTGCAGTATYANRANLCGASAHACNANEWVQNQGGTAPTHHYWTDDNLNWSSVTGACGSGACATGNCFASAGGTYTATCTGNPMHVCAGTGTSNVTDPENNSCTWTGCGFNSISPKQFFGGCTGNTTAGTLCCSNVQHEYFVSVSGSDSNAGNSAAPFKTITHALAAAVAGDTVLVKTGVYDGTNGETFPLNVPASVNLIGDEPSRGTSPVTKIGGTVVPGAASTVAGFTITSPSFGINATGNGSIIRNNTLTGNGSFPIRITSPNQTILLNAVVSNSSQILYTTGSTATGKFENNTVTGNNGGGVEYDAPGADMGGGPGGSVGNNILSCNARFDVWAGSAAITASSNKWDHSPPSSSNVSFGGGLDLYYGSFTSSQTSANTGATVTASPCNICSTTAVSSQPFDLSMNGCGASGTPAAIAYASRATLCGSQVGCHVCTASEWNSHRGTTGPNTNYWTGDNPLNYVSGSTGACSVSTTAGSSVCTTSNGGISSGAMLVCPNGGLCQQTSCGLDTTTPQFFGGCSTSSGGTNFGFAQGTLCCCP